MIWIFITEYLKSRQWKLLFSSIPALLAIIAFGILMVRPPQASGRDVIKKYEIEFEQASRTQDSQEMWICARTLVDLQPRSLKAKFQLAQSLLALEKTNEASAIMRNLAPDNRSGYKPAHSWIADQIRRNLPQPPTRESIELLIHHLASGVKPNNIDIDHEIGRLYLLIDDSTLAEAYFQSSDLPEASLELAQIYHSRNEPSKVSMAIHQANDRFAEQLKRYPTNVGFRCNWATSLFMQGDINAAIRLLQESAPTNDADRKQLAKTYVLASKTLNQLVPLDSTRAIQLLEVATQLDPTEPQVLDWTIAILEKGVSLPETLVSSTRSKLDKILSETPGNKIMLVLLGRLQNATGNYQKAIEIYEKLVSEDPSKYLSLAKVHYAAKNFFESKVYAKKATDFYKSAESQESLTYQLQYAEALCFIGKFEESRQYMEKLEANALVMSAIGKTWLLEAQFADPLDIQTRHSCLEESFNAYPESATPINLLAKDLTKDDDSRTSARKHLYQMLTRGLHHDLIHLLLGTDAIRDENWSIGIQHLEQALSIRKDDPMLLNNLAHALLNSPNSDLNRALALVNRANEIVPDHPSILDTRGQINFRLQKYDQCVTDLEQVISKQPDPSKTHQILADAYESLGNDAAAKEHRTAAE